MIIRVLVTIEGPIDDPKIEAAEIQAQLQEDRFGRVTVEVVDDVYTQGYIAGSQTGSAP